MKKSIWETLSEREFDVSDTPVEPAPGKRKGPPSAVPVRRDPKLAAKGHAYNPGMPPERQKNEDVPLSPGVPQGKGSSANAAYSRSKSKTMPMIPALPPKVAEPAPAGGPQSFDVSNTKGEVFRVQADSPQQALQMMMDFMADERARQGIKGELHPGEFKVRPAAQAESTGAANGAGFQLPMGDAEEAAKRVYKEALHEFMRETVRKLPNGKYGVYMKNKGKKKAPKKVGEYPDRIAAREAELSRGGKSGDAAKKEREKLGKLKKDPKKMAAAKKRDSKVKPKKVAKESLIGALTQGINEALFREEDIPGSTWDERLAGLSPTALASNKKLAAHTKNIHKASVSSLMDAQKLLAKALKGHGKVNHGEIGTETGGKMFLPCMLDVDGEEHGPIYLYVDGGHVKMEMDEGMNESMDGMEEADGHKLRGALMAFQEKQLPKLDAARIAVANRDKDLDRMEKDHDDELSGRDGVSLHLLKHLIGMKHGRRFR